jgi:hypothetical protein
MTATDLQACMVSDLHGNTLREAAAAPEDVMACALRPQLLFFVCFLCIIFDCVFRFVSF